MAIEGTYLFNPDLGEIMEEAYERAGVEFQTAAHIKSARRSLNLISLEWQNEGINLWTIDEQTISSATIAEGTASYDIDINTIAILDAVIRTDAGDSSLQNDLPMSRISQSMYSSISNKLTEGKPVQYWFNRIGVRAGTSGGSDVNSTVTFWPVPDESNKYTFVYWRMRRISDAGHPISNTVDIPDRFIPALIAALAYEVGSKRPTIDPLRLEVLKAKKEETWQKATEEDRVKTDFRVLPDVSSYGY